MLDTLTATRLRTHLREIPKLCCYAWLDLIPSTTVRYGSIHTARLHAPAPVNEQVLSLLGPGDYLAQPDPHGDQAGRVPVAAVLNAWCMIVTGRRHRNISSACKVLLERWPATTGNHYSRQLATDIAHLHAALEGAAHAYSHRRTLNLPCPKCGLLGLQALSGCDIRCGNCDATMTQADYDRRADTYADALGA